MPEAAPRLVRLTERTERTVDLTARQVWSTGEGVRLSEREAQRLSYLSQHPVSRDQLLTEVWGL